MYKYKNPIELGYKEIKMSRKQYEQVFGHKVSWANVKKVYVNDRGNIKIHTFNSTRAFIVATLMLPYAILMEGLNEINIKEDLLQYVTIKTQQKYGNFSSDIRIRKYEGQEENKYVVKCLNKMKELNLL